MKKLSLILGLCMIFMLTACGQTSSEPAVAELQAESVNDVSLSQQESATSSVNPDSQIDDNSKFDVDQVQYAYNDIINEILNKHESDFNRGCISDFFNDGINDMVLTYTTDEKSIYAGIYVWNDDHVESEIVKTMDMAGGARTEIYPGYYGEGDDTPCFYVISTNYDGDRLFGSVVAYSIENNVITSVYSEDFEDSEQWENIAGNPIINLGECACAFATDGAGSPIENLRVS